jgi:hypothetical protein
MASSTFVVSNSLLAAFHESQVHKLHGTRRAVVPSSNMRASSARLVGGGGVRVGSLRLYSSPSSSALRSWRRTVNNATPAMMKTSDSDEEADDNNNEAVKRLTCEGDNDRVNNATPPPPPPSSLLGKLAKLAALAAIAVAVTALLFPDVALAASKQAAAVATTDPSLLAFFKKAVGFVLHLVGAVQVECSRTHSSKALGFNH